LIHIIPLKHLKYLRKLITNCDEFISMPTKSINRSSVEGQMIFKITTPEALRSKSQATRKESGEKIFIEHGKRKQTL